VVLGGGGGGGKSGAGEGDFCRASNISFVEKRVGEDRGKNKLKPMRAEAHHNRLGQKTCVTSTKVRKRIVEAIGGLSMLCHFAKRG